MCQNKEKRNDFFRNFVIEMKFSCDLKVLNHLRPQL